MRFISFELLMEALKEQGLDAVYEKLYELFYEAPLYITDRYGAVVYIPYDALDLWDYLEALYDNINNIDKEVEP
jgi:hypothetical protein